LLLGVVAVTDRFFPFLPTGFFFSFLAGRDRRGPSSLWPTSSPQPTERKTGFPKMTKIFVQFVWSNIDVLKLS
jgi:hypothetical protein